MPTQEVDDDEFTPVGTSDAPDGSRVLDADEEEEDEIKPWDRYFSKAPPEVKPEKVADGWQLIHDGRFLEDALWAAAAELNSDLLWGNLKLPIEKTLEKLRFIEMLKETPEAERTTKSFQEEAVARRECREMLELSTQQLEEMCEKKGEFGNEYRVVTAGWYMMMLPDTNLKSHLVAPHDASKIAWEFQEREFERRRVEGEKYRTAREEETLFDAEAAMAHPYELTQTIRRYDMEVTIPVPAKTRAADVRIQVKAKRLTVYIATHPLSPVIDGELFREIHRGEGASSGGEWHLEGEFESRRLVLDLEKTKLADWPCLMLADAPEPTPTSDRPVLSGANGDVDVYAEDAKVLERPQRSDKFFCWGPAPPPKPPTEGAASVQQARAELQKNAPKPKVVKSKGGGAPPLAKPSDVKPVDVNTDRSAKPC